MAAVERRRARRRAAHRTSRLNVCGLVAAAACLCLRLGCLATWTFSVSLHGRSVSSQPAPSWQSGARARGALADGQAQLAQRASRSAWPLRALPELFTSFQAVLDSVPQQVAELGPLGPAYFFAVYVVAECLALPATPLTLSAGYLFGLPLGCAVSLAGGTVAAGIGFLLSRTLLRPQITELAAGNETFQNVNRAVESEGFKIILLLRLSPLLPFALSNYLYGLSNVGFLDFIAATALGFAPGTCAFVYFATTARSVLSESGEGQPWYVYAVGIAVTVALLKVVSDVAKQAVDEAIEAEQASGSADVAVASGQQWTFDKQAQEREVLATRPLAPTEWMEDSLKEKLGA
mmetsp:Transcript_63303/g.185043  ORF Transcript_63303/g.185043 Transcript_63303/m.185043 type:complete len:348 (+) Transcript_63303:73-1116(+)